MLFGGLGPTLEQVVEYSYTLVSSKRCSEMSAFSWSATPTNSRRICGVGPILEQVVEHSYSLVSSKQCSGMSAFWWSGTDFGAGGGTLV